MSAPRLPTVYGALLRGEMMATSGYRANLIISMIGWVVPFVMLALWRGAAADGPIESITAGQFTTYFAVVLLTTAFSLAGHLIYGFTPLVHDGRLAHYLQRPYHPFHNIIADALSATAFRAITVFVLFAGVLGLVGAEFGPSAALPVAVLLWVAGLVGTAYIAALAGTTALWVTRAYGLQSLAIGAEGLLGGMYAPVMLLPGWLEIIARHTPFWFQIGAPAELVAGILDTRDGLIAIAEAVVWVGALHALFRVVWRRGLRQYELVGG